MAKTIKLDHITKIEGHARMQVKIDSGKVKKVQMEVFEGARYFEGLLKGRSFDEAPVLTSRICGICPQVHMITSLKAVETAFGVKPSEQTIVLRKLLLNGQILQSNALHLYFLALPDYLGYGNVFELSDKYRTELKLALRLKRFTNDLVTVIGGREVHSITPVVGGFSKIPSKEKIKELQDQIPQIKKDIDTTFKLFNKLQYPDLDRESHYFSIEDPKEYALYDGSLKCFGSKCVPVSGYDSFLKEYTQRYSTAKFSTIEGREYMVGALARINNNMKKLHPDAKKALGKAKVKFPCYNPFMNNLAQAIELIHLIYDIEKLLKYRFHDEEPVMFNVKAGRGVGVCEAPRGILIHEYVIDKEGKIDRVNIMTPTAQNLKNIEEDVKVLLPGMLKKGKKEIVHMLEMLVRAYDPCISCSAHFLEVKGLD